MSRMTFCWFFSVSVLCFCCLLWIEILTEQPSPESPSVSSLPLLKQTRSTKTMPRMRVRYPERALHPERIKWILAYRKFLKAKAEHGANPELAHVYRHRVGEDHPAFLEEIFRSSD